MASVSDFKTRFPEFVSIMDARINLFLDDAALRMNDPQKWLDFYDVAQCYLAAHLLAIADNSRRGDSGIVAPISHQEVDDVVIRQAVSSAGPDQDELLGTSYGKRYWTYRKMVLCGPRGV